MQATPVVKRVRPLNALKARDMDLVYQARAETLLAVDDMISEVIQVCTLVHALHAGLHWRSAWEASCTA
jgi:hypothetical protein